MPDIRSDLLTRAQQLFPGGVNSPVRAFGAVGGTPSFIQRADGCFLFDVEGRKYIDYIGAWGPMILGHAHPIVVETIRRTAADGTAYGITASPEIELAEEIISRMPSVRKVRMVNSGTEAVMSAIRLARAATGRNKIVKFSGCYHGHADSLLVEAGSGAATFGVPNSPGIPEGCIADTLVADFNDQSSVERLFEARGPKIAAVIVEPVAGNMGVIAPQQGFLEFLRKITKQTEALLIFDEVMTGFRIAQGGAQERYEIQPDLTTLGKIIGGGLPVGAFGGRAELMDRIAPAGPVYQAGTMSGNPLSMAAGLATLRLLDQAAYEKLEKISARLENGLRRAIANANVDATVQRVGSMLTVFFSRNPVTNYRDAAATDHKGFAQFFHGMMRRGVFLPPSGYEAWFVSLAHDDGIIDQTIDAAQEAFAEVQTPVA